MTNQNQNKPNPNKRKNQQQNPQRVEFGTEIDVDQMKEQNTRNQKQKNTPLDPRDNRF